MPPHTVDAVDSISPPNDDVVDLVPSLEGEIVVDDEAKAFRGSPVDLSLLSIYPDHTTIHIWGG